MSRKSALLACDIHKGSDTDIPTIDLYDKLDLGTLVELSAVSIDYTPILASRS